MLPQIGLTSEQRPLQFQIKAFPSRTHRLRNDLIIGYIDGERAIEQTVYHILSVERWAYPIYSNSYGVEFERLIGKDFNYIKATIGETIKSALLQDDRIVNVIINRINQTDLDSMEVLFTVYHNLGSFESGVTINV